MCIGIVEIWFGIANGQISYVRISLTDDNFSKYQWIFTKFGIDVIQGGLVGYC